MDDSPWGPEALNNDPSRFHARKLTAAQSLPDGRILPDPARSTLAITPEPSFNASAGG
jgi:hypothetical protein